MHRFPRQLLRPALLEVLTAYVLRGTSLYILSTKESIKIDEPHYFHENLVFFLDARMNPPGFILENQPYCIADKLINSLASLRIVNEQNLNEHL